MAVSSIDGIRQTKKSAISRPKTTNQQVIQFTYEDPTMASGDSKTSNLINSEVSEEPTSSLVRSIPVIMNRATKPQIIFKESFAQRINPYTANFSSLSHTGELTMDKDTTTDDLLELVQASQESLVTFASKYRYFAALVTTFVGHYFNLITYRAYALAVRTYEHVQSIPDYIAQMREQVVQFVNILRIAQLRDMWMLQQRVLVREFVSDTQVLLRTGLRFIKAFYLLFFVLACVGFLSISSVMAKTNDSSLLKDSVRANAYQAKPVFRSAAQSGESLLSKNLVEFSSVVKSYILAHTVTGNEDVSFIAKLYNVSVDSITFNNSLTTESKLTPGQTIYVPPANGYIYVAAEDISVGDLARIYRIDESDIRALNPELAGTASLAKNKLAFIPLEDFAVVKELNKIEETRVAAVKAEQTRAAQRNTALSAASYNVITYIPDTTRMALNFGWPTDNHRISCGFLCYGGHYAIDLDGGGQSLAPIYSISDGVVIETMSGCLPRQLCAGSANPWYGNYIIVQHADGYQSVYAHMNDVSVSVGQTVSKGESIGHMGNTGNVYGSTGVHLHLEIRKNGAKTNPLIYLP